MLRGPSPGTCKSFLQSPNANNVMRSALISIFVIPVCFWIQYFWVYNSVIVSSFFLVIDFRCVSNCESVCVDGGYWNNVIMLRFYVCFAYLLMVNWLRNRRSCSVYMAAKELRCCGVGCNWTVWPPCAGQPVMSCDQVAEETLIAFSNDDARLALIIHARCDLTSWDGLTTSHCRYHVISHARRARWKLTGRWDNPLILVLITCLAEQRAVIVCFHFSSVKVNKAFRSDDILTRLAQVGP